MEKSELIFSTEKIITSLNKLVKLLDNLKLDTLSSNLYDLSSGIKIIQNSLINLEYILEKELKEIIITINEYIDIFLKSVNNQELDNLIKNFFDNEIKDLYSDVTNYKYLKYKQKYYQLKNK